MSVEDGLCHRRVRRAAPLRPGAGAGDPRRRRCGPRWRAPCRWPSGSGSGRPTTGRTAPGRPRRASPGTTARSAGTPSGIVEVRAGDRAGLLYRLTAAIAGEGLDVTSARIETLGADAVDSFYVCNPSGSPLGPPSSGRPARSTAALVRRRPAAQRPRTPHRERGHRHAGLGPRFCRWAVRRSQAERDGTVPPVERSSFVASRPSAAGNGPARPVATSGRSCSLPAATGTPTTAASAPSGPAPTAASAFMIGDAAAVARRPAPPSRRLSPRYPGVRWCGQPAPVTSEDVLCSRPSPTAWTRSSPACVARAG